MRRKKIYFECTALVADHFSGVGHYVKGIAQAWNHYITLPEHAELQTKNQTRYTTVFCASKNRMKRLDKFRLDNIYRKAILPPARIVHKLLDSGMLPPLDLWYGRGTYLFTNFARYPLLNSKSATIVYDISYEVVPQYADANNARLSTVQTQLTSCACCASKAPLLKSTFTVESWSGSVVLIRFAGGLCLRHPVAFR